MFTLVSITYHLEMSLHVSIIQRLMATIHKSNKTLKAFMSLLCRSQTHRVLNQLLMQEHTFLPTDQINCQI